MARLNESVITVKISRLVRDSEVISDMIDADTITNLEAVLEELIGDPTAVIEISKTDE